MALPTINDIMNTQQINKSQGIVIAEKINIFKGQLFGHISNGGGELNLGNGKSIRFISTNDKFITLQLIEYGIGAIIKNQSWVKSKKVIIKKEKVKDDMSFKHNKKVREI